MTTLSATPRAMPRIRHRRLRVRDAVEPRHSDEHAASFAAAYFAPSATLGLLMPVSAAAATRERVVLPVHHATITEQHQTE